jgi:uncharacterized metal-binding protein
MPNLPRKKVGLIACSGEELPEGTVTRRAVRKVLESLRPDDTVTLCLPLFLAGGEGERAFARYYPTIAVDGCDKRCAALATEKYSAKPAASIVVSEIAADAEGHGIGTAHHLNEAGIQLADSVAQLIAEESDRLLKKPRRKTLEPAADFSGCGCSSGLPSGTVRILGRATRVAGLPLILAQFRDQGRGPDQKTGAALLEAVKIYNEVPDSQQHVWKEALFLEYVQFFKETG